MYPDNAYPEFYPMNIVEKVFKEWPSASVKEKHILMQQEWVDADPETAASYGYRPLPESRGSI
jgi:hypothetical protein